MGCLDQNTLVRLHGEQLGNAELLRVQQHLAECDDCRDLSAAVHLSIVGRATAVQRSTGVTRATGVTRVDRRRQVGPARVTEQMTAHMNVTRLDDELGESAPEHVPHLWAGDSVDHYEVLLMLGRGAMGEVYLAQDTKLGRKVALKLMRAEMFMNDEAARRFQNEARAMAQINHPNVVTIHAVGEYEGVPYVAMEFVRGQSLYERLDPGLDDEEARRIALAVASALQQAHELGIVHRDLKPENVIAARDGAVKVLDFGLAKTVSMDREDSFADTPMPGGDETMTRLGARVGTPLYMSPEQWRMAEITTATDVWAFGILLYEMHTGRVPFRGVDLAELAHKICDPDVPPADAPEIPPAIQGIIARCLRRDASERPSITQVIAALERAGAKPEIQAPPTPAPLSLPPVPAPPPSAKWPLVVAALMLLVGGVAIGMTLSVGDAAPSPSSAAASAAPAPSVDATDAADTADTADAVDATDATLEDAPEPAASASSEVDGDEEAAAPTSAPSPVVVPRPPLPRPVRPRPQPAITKDPFSEPPSNAGY